MDWKTRIPALILWLALVFNSLGDGNAEQRVVCYYTNWSVYRPGTAKFSPQNINPYLCTHLIYAFGGFTKENTLKPFDKYQDIEKGGYAKFTGLKTYNKNLKTMLAIGGWNEGSSRFSPMVADPGRRKEFVKNSVKFLRQNHFDGLDLDWEYPAFRDGGKPRDRKNYADLVQELREEFERESSKTGRPRLLLSMAVPAGIEYIDKGYDIPRLNDYLDFINLLSYDYHSAFEPAVNHHAPLYPLEEDNEYNYDTELTIDYTIQHLLQSGASSEKIVLGIPTYGRSYTLFNEEATEIGAPADGPGEEGDATREKGYLAYYEICESVAKSDEWEVVQPNPTAMGPYAFREKQWVGYDDEDIVRAKARYVNEKKLGGIMFWSIDNDDFRGKCHGRPYPLIEAAKEALLAGDEKSTSGLKTKVSDSRKKTRIQAGSRIQGNTIGRKLNAGNRRTTTQATASRRRIASSRTNTRTNGRGGYNAEDNEEEEEEEENSVKTPVENSRTRNRSKARPKGRVTSGGRRKQQQNTRQQAKETNDESLGNKLTTPEPPTTPDPGSDFKCEDEGFFPHPRDCKKYFWCLDSGPSGLGIVGHAFTCPSGLVFNKAADSCDYPRNVVCPKTKTSQSTVSTTRAPITAATSKTTYLYKPTQRTTTSKPESEEEYEYYDDEEVADEEAEEEEPRVTTTARTLQYKTISRGRPTSTTTPTTETPIVTSTRANKATTERDPSFEDEEDPRVLKELIDLIRKAGGIEQLEKQLNFQEKNSAGSIDKAEENGRSTPATISRSLYERVLNRQATRIAGGFLGSLTTTKSPNGDNKSDRGSTNSRTGFVNGPGGAQFEGLDNVPEVKSLRRTHKPQYVTIERNRTPTSESPLEDDEEIDDEADEDNTDVASSEDQAVSNQPQQRPASRRVTPSYVNIRRPRPSTTTSENDVEVKDEDSNTEDAEEEEETVPQRHRIVKTEEESSSPKSRYTNVQRFRSTTSRSSEEDQAEEVVSKNDLTTESTTTTTTTTTTTEKEIPVTEELEEASSSTTAESSTSAELANSSTLENISSSIESTTSSIPESTSDSLLKLVDDSATEILFTTAAAASSSSTGSSSESFTRGPSVAAVSQPRPFGFPRRGRPTTTTASTTSVAPVTEQSRIKVVSETLRLPTLKELVGYTPTQTEPIPLTSTITQSSTTFVDKTIESNALRDELLDRTIPKDQLEMLVEGLVGRVENATGDDKSTSDLERGREKEIFDNDILGSEEIQRRSSSSSFVDAALNLSSATDQKKGHLNPGQTIKRVQVPVKIIDDASGKELTDLVILQVPESQLNSAIRKPVFRVKILEQDSSKSNSHHGQEASSENEVPDVRRTQSRRRRVRIQSSPSAAAVADATGDESEDRVASRSRSRNRHRIVKMRKRIHVPLQEVTTNESVEGHSIAMLSEIEENQESEKDDIRPEDIRLVDMKLLLDANNTTEHSTEPTTTIRATTLRRNLSTPSKVSTVVRGFYVTKSSLETLPPLDAITTESPIDSTQFPSTTSGNDVFDEAETGKTDLATHIGGQTVSSLAKGIPDFAEESSTYESVGTTFVEPQSTTKILNDNNVNDFLGNNIVTLLNEKLETSTLALISTIEDRSNDESSSSATTSITANIDSLPDNLTTFVDEKLETSTPASISTIDDRFTKSTAAASTITEEATSEQPEVTTYRPWTSSREVQTTNPTTLKETSTPEYFMETKSDLITEYLSESLKTSENSHYGHSLHSEVESTTVLKTESESENLDIASSSVPTTTTLDENNDDVRITSQTERFLRRKTTRPGTAFENLDIENSSVPTSMTELDDNNATTTSSKKNSVIAELDDNDVKTSLLQTERSVKRKTTLDDKTTPQNLEVKSTTVATTDELVDDNSIPSTLQTERSARRKTTPGETAATYGGASSRGTIRFTATSQPETSKFSSREQSRKTTTKSSEIVDENLKAREEELDKKRRTTLTESYEKTTDHPILVDATGSPRVSPSRYRDYRRRTTTSIPIDDSTVNNPFTEESSTVASSTETYDKTVQYTSSTGEEKQFRTNLVESAGSFETAGSSTWRSSEHPHRITKILEGGESTTLTASYDKTAMQHTTAASEAKELGTNFIETTASDSYIDNADKSTKSFTDSDDFTSNLTTEEEFISTNGRTIDYASTTPEVDYLSTNSVETTGSDSYNNGLSMEETESLATTTEHYDKTKNTFEATSSTIDVSTREEEYQTESMKSIETTVNIAETEGTRPWTYLQRGRVTYTTEDYKTESVDISNDLTADIESETLAASITEAYLSSDRTEMTTATEPKDTETKINDQYENSVEVTQPTTESTTSLKTEATKKLTFATTLASTIYDKSEESTAAIFAETTTDQNVIQSTTEGSLSTSPDVIVEKLTTVTHKDRKASRNFTTDSSTTHRAVNRSRGRVRFTNFAAIVDETGIIKRPVKQVVVRRRLANDSTKNRTEVESPKSSRNQNRQFLSKERKDSVKLAERLADETKHSTSLNAQLTEEKKRTESLSVRLTEEKKQTAHLTDRLNEKKNSTKLIDRLTDEQKINATKPLRRRVIVYRGRPRAENVTSTTTMQSLVGASSDEISDDSSRTRRRKWKKKVVRKRVKRTEEADDDDQNVAESGDFRRALIDFSFNSNFRLLGSSIEDRELANSAEQSSAEDTGGEVNLYKSSGSFLRRPGTLVQRREGINRSRTKPQEDSVPILLPEGPAAPFSKIRPVADDQSGRAQEVAVTLADPPAVRSSATTGRLPSRTTSATRKISTTIAPRTEAPTASRTTPFVRRRQRPRGNSDNVRVVENVTTRPRRPAIIDYDYYVDDDDIRLVVKPELKDKLFVTRNGGIRCLDQGNFAHPTSCKKFITCARMVNGQVIGTEYTCPDKLSFDPVGGICNWSAGLGCEETKA